MSRAADRQVFLKHKYCNTRPNILCLYQTLDGQHDILTTLYEPYFESFFEDKATVKPTLIPSVEPLVLVVFHIHNTEYIAHPASFRIIFTRVFLVVYI